MIVPLLHAVFGFISDSFIRRREGFVLNDLILKDEDLTHLRSHL
jgi:hypothetical protein